MIFIDFRRFFMIFMNFHRFSSIFDDSAGWLAAAGARGFSGLWQPVPPSAARLAALKKEELQPAGLEASSIAAWRA